MTRISLFLIVVALSSCLGPEPGGTSGQPAGTTTTTTTTSTSTTTTAPTSTSVASTGAGTGPTDPSSTASTSMEGRNFIDNDLPPPDPSFPPYPPPSCQQGEGCSPPHNVCVDLYPDGPEYQGSCLRIFDEALFGCDVSLQDCPEDYKCVHPWAFYGEGFAGACVPLSSAPVDLAGPCSVLDPYLSLDEDGDSLIYPDDYPAGSQCWMPGGHCTTLCMEAQFDSGECPLPDHYCGSMRDSVFCVEICDPLVQDCPEGDTCVFGDYQAPPGCFLDLSEDEGQVFDPCYDDRLCDPGLVCIGSLSAKECDPNEQGCCSPYCDLNQPAACPGVGQECVVYFESQDVAEGYENIGVCSLPP